MSYSLGVNLGSPGGKWFSLSEVTCFTALEYFEGVQNDHFWTLLYRGYPFPFTWCQPWVEHLLVILPQEDDEW